MPVAINTTARHLAALSLDPETGVPSVERVRAVLETLETTSSPSALRGLLKAYRVALSREVAKSEARIEHAGPLPPETVAVLTAHFSKVFKRRITPVVRENPGLAVGLRVRVGDNIYDSSASSILGEVRKVRSSGGYARHTFWSAVAEVAPKGIGSHQRLSRDRRHRF